MTNVTKGEAVICALATESSVLHFGILSGFCIDSGGGLVGFWLKGRGCSDGPRRRLDRNSRNSSGSGSFVRFNGGAALSLAYRSEEHTSELQRQFHLVCLLLH